MQTQVQWVICASRKMIHNTACAYCTCAFSSRFHDFPPAERLSAGARGATRGAARLCVHQVSGIRMPQARKCARCAAQDGTIRAAGV